LPTAEAAPLPPLTPHAVNVGFIASSVLWRKIAVHEVSKLDN
jgi:hypothetical protein